MKFKWRAWVRRLTILMVLLFGAPTLTSFIVALCFIAVGLFMHIWAIGCLVRNKELTTWGPYRLVRHPFYLANLCIDLGLCAAGAGNLPIGIFLFVVYALMFYFVYIRRMKMEEAHLITLYPAEYPEYMKQVPRFIPMFFKGLPKKERGFSFKVLVAAGNEITRIIRLLIYPLVLYLAWQIFPRGIGLVLYYKVAGYHIDSSLMGAINKTDWIIFGVIIALSIVSVFFHRHEKKDE